MYLTRESMSSIHLATGKNIYKSSAYLARMGALLFVYEIQHKRNHSTNHNYKCEQIRICNHGTNSFHHVR